MVAERRLSALSALVIGVFLVIATAIGSGTLIVLYGMNIVDGKARTALAMADATLTRLPEIIESLPAALKDALHDRRDPAYARHLEVSAELVVSESGDWMRPAVTIRNGGEEVVSLLAVRTVAMNDKGTPVAEWTSVVATPLAVEGDWRGPLMPGATRHVLLNHGRYRGRLADSDSLVSKVEVVDVRVWQPAAEPTAAITAARVGP